MGLLKGPRGVRLRMSEAALYSTPNTVNQQGYLAHKKTPPPRTLQQAEAWDPTIVLGGVRVPVSEVTL